MGVEIPNGYGQATLRFSCVGVTKPILVTMGFKNEQITANNPAGQLATSIRGVLTSGPTKLLHASQFSSQYTFTGVDVSLGIGGDIVQGSALGNVVGTIASATVPVNSALLVRKNTGMGGRKNRGRMYLPPAWFQESEVNANGAIPSTSQFTNLQTALELWRTDMDGVALHMAILHSDPVAEPTLITGLSLQPTLATQRRRMR